MRKNAVTGDPCVANKEKNGKKCLLLSFALCFALLFSACTVEKKPENMPSPTPSPRLTVYVDAGHGDFDFGAVGLTEAGEQVLEKDLTLSIATLVAEGLREAGHTVILSRTGDDRLTYTNSRDELLARRAAAIAGGADLLLSIHVNAYAGEGRAYGARVYHHPESAVAAAYAEALAAAVTQHTGALIGRPCRVVTDGSFLILGEPILPSLLFEVGFLSDPTELPLLTDPTYQKRLADAVAEALG
ncbi:MAG: N-acetylmuramoyl-L-alanine amidase [Clostridia bacterium]|nr:N-acetylmuramoyl-L-alanine amidase [Clostridia bacterium]